jgi:DNA-binding transcriptional regulator YdaS (Cro superfamily)
MELANYLSRRGAQAELARKLKVTPVLVHQWANSRPVPIDRCLAIEIATNGEVTRKDLRPDDWFKIWPDLFDNRRAKSDRRANRRGDNK